MPLLVYIIIISFLISSASLIGIFFSIKKELTKKILLFLVSLSAGTLMGGAFLHLMPEAANQLSINILFSLVLLSFILFYFIEKILYWRHCHDENCEVHTFGHMNLIGDSIHNFIDGLIIAATFLTDIKLGITTSLAIALHEIPQEIGDFGVLLYAGFEKKKALIINFLVALMVVMGSIIGYFLSFKLEKLTTYLLLFAAGGFIYISTSDLIPEIRKERNIKKSLISFAFFLVGIGLMWLAKLLNL